MTILTLTALLSTITLTFLLARTPITLGINILILALLLATLIAIIMRPWFGFLIFLIYIGGILVMFAYFLALVPNQQIPDYINALYFIITAITLMSIALLIEISVPIPQRLYSNTAFIYIPKICPSVIFIGVLLLITIIIVVKLTARIRGPLRPFLYV